MHPCALILRSRARAASRRTQPRILRSLRQQASRRAPTIPLPLRARGRPGGGRREQKVPPLPTPSSILPLTEGEEALSPVRSNRAARAGPKCCTATREATDRPTKCCIAASAGWFSPNPMLQRSKSGLCVTIPGPRGHKARPALGVPGQDAHLSPDRCLSIRGPTPQNTKALKTNIYLASLVHEKD